MFGVVDSVIGGTFHTCNCFSCLIRLSKQWCHGGVGVGVPDFEKRGFYAVEKMCSVVRDIGDHDDGGGNDGVGVPCTGLEKRGFYAIRKMCSAVIHIGRDDGEYDGVDVRDPQSDSPPGNGNRDNRLPRRFRHRWLPGT